MRAIDPEDEEDAALHWAGDEVSGREGARLPDKKIQDVVAGSGGDVATADPGPQSGSALLLTGVFGVVYLALTVGWILAVQTTGSGGTGLLGEVLWQFGEFTAIVAAPLWFGATLTMTRGGRLLTRAGWLALGVGLLLPWPLLPLLAVVA